MSKSTRSLIGAASVMAAGALIAVGTSSVGAKSSGKADSGTVYFAVTHTVGAKQYAAGNANDRLFGSGAVTYVNVAKANPTGTIIVTTKPVVLFFKDGTMTGVATSKLTIGKNGTATITDGKLTAAHGTGGQKGHSFVDTFTGTGNATTSNYKIIYKGTYR